MGVDAPPVEKPAAYRRRCSAFAICSRGRRKGRLMAKKIFLFAAGALLLIVGIVMVLVWWKDVVSLFRGGVGMVVALAGMLVLYMARE